MKNPLKVIRDLAGGKNKGEALEHKRHTLAHLMAAAVKELWPDAKNTIGPAIDNGFYYDFEFSSQLSDDDLSSIEKKMREILRTWEKFDRKVVSADEARNEFPNNEYKLELINELEQMGEEITIYTSGNFTDLCRGGHCKNPNADIKEDSFKLERVAGAYWRGSEKNKMLTRIYGLAFNDKNELKDYIELRKEAEKRDHRKLGKDMDLFLFSDLVGQGLPLWTPKGTLMRDLLDARVWKLRKERGYEKVTIPHITKKDLYEKSGHWSKFADELFHIKTREGHEFVMKPMNCPHHTQIYARKAWSYRQLPQRYSETTMVYRDEQSGELAGLSRVRSITQDDAHVFCRYSHIKGEITKVIEIIEKFYGDFKIEITPTLSTHDKNEMSKYMGEESKWLQMEDELRDILKERNYKYKEYPGEAAFYGPKIDFIGYDALGRKHQVATIQLDMNQPEGFDLTCVNEKGEKERIVMIHVAIMGSIERFFVLLLEHTVGNFPVWLAPVQVTVLPITDTQKKYAKEVCDKLLAEGFRAELDDTSETLGKKIRTAKLEKVPYFLVIGDQEMRDEQVMVESRDAGKVGATSITDFITRLKSEI